MSEVVTRIAPSPTGEMHIGTVRTALFSYLYAKKNNGKFLVRIEDTDTSRNRADWTEMIWRDFAWCGLVADKKYIQSEHLARHTELLQKLIAENKAYVSKEPSHDDPSTQVEVIRLRNQNKVVTFNDEIHGEIKVDTTDLGDFVIARSLTAPLYHFAVVVDDADAGVTHVLRGEDILSSTPRQILIQEALGFSRPVYVHLPLILGKDKKKLSKRKQVVSLDSYRNEGFIPAGIVNYLALLGWNPKTDEEIFTMDELISRFSFEGLQQSGAVFDDVKLKWFNREHMLRMSTEDFWLYAKPFLREDVISFIERAGRVAEFVAVLRERASTFGEIKASCEVGEYDFYPTAPNFDRELITSKSDAESARDVITSLIDLLDKIDIKQWNKDSVKEALMPYADQTGRTIVLWPLRTILSGRERSPDPFTIAGIIGKDETISRLTNSRSVFER